MELKLIKKKTISKLKADADKWFSYFIRIRDNNICFICGKKMDFVDSQAGHLISRTATAIRWDERNVFCSCGGCNYRHEFRPEVMTNIFIDTFGLDEYQRLYLLSKRTEKLSRLYLENLATSYKERYQELITNRSILHEDSQG
jgi:hypothetical protein